MLEIICRLGYKALWINNKKDLMQQALDRAKANIVNCKFGTITEGKVDIQDITFATIQTLCRVDLDSIKNEFGIIVVDECFPKDTPILTKNGIKKIQNIKLGDKILSYNHKKNKIEEKEVLNLFKKIPDEMIVINDNFVCTSNHPIFTKRGYVEAKELTKNDYVLLYMPKRSKKRKFNEKSIFSLQSKRKGILFERMCNRYEKKSDFCQKCKLYRKTKENKFGDFKRKMERQRFQRKKYSENENSESYAQSRYNKKTKRNFKKNWSQTTDTRWKWKRAYNSSIKNIKCFKRKRNKCYCRICTTNKNEKRFWLSNKLQNRCSNFREKNSNRNRWRISLLFKSSISRQKERRTFNWIRVESIKIQKQTSDGKFGGLCKDGYVYNIEVKDNNNYFANNVLVHNCHTASGTPTKLTQYYNVLSKLSARYKYGCTACLHRGDGLMQAGIDLLGDIAYTVPEEAIADKIMKASVVPIYLNYTVPDELIGEDGVINSFAELTTDLCLNEDRNNYIIELIKSKKNEHCIVLSDRLSQLKYIKEKVGSGLLIDGTMVSKKGKEQRRQAIEKMRNGEENILYATYSLAKEGLDIPILDTLIMASPKKDKSVIIQSVGRIERKYDGKINPTVYDIIDIDPENGFCLFENMFYKRKTVYKKNGNEILSEF